MKVDCENNPLAGLQKEESRPLTSVTGCPPYAGVGNNRLVGRQVAGLREHNLGVTNMDIDATWNKDLVDLEVKDCDLMSHSNTNDLDSNTEECSELGTLRLRGGGSPERDCKGRFVGKGRPGPKTSKESKETTVVSARTVSPSKSEVPEALTREESQSRPGSRRSLPDLRVNLSRCDESQTPAPSSSTKRKEAQAHVGDKGVDIESDTGSMLSIRSEPAPDNKHGDGAESDSDMSCYSLSDTERRRRFWRKRGRGGLGSDSDETTEKRSQSASKRGRGRPPTTGQYVGLTKAKEEYNRAKREEMRLRAEEEVAGIQLPFFNSQSDKRSKAGWLRLALCAGCPLCGCALPALKDAAVSIKETFECLLERTTSEETRHLQAQNDSLRVQLTELKAEMAQLRADFRDQFKRPSPAPPLPTEHLQPSGSSRKDTAGFPNTEEMMRSMTAQMGLMLDARLETLELEGRLLPAQPMRPPLAADRRHQAPHSQESEPAPKPNPKVRRGPPNLTEEPQKGKKRNKKKTTLAAVEAAAVRGAAKPAPRALPSAPIATDKAWNIAAKGGKKKKAGRGPQQKGKLAAIGAATSPRSQKQEASKLRPPRSTAVVLSLQPEAEEKGITYKSVIAAAKTQVDLSELDIQSVRFKVAATGARLLEVPGAASGPKADKLAEKLSQLFSPEEVRVSRPTKCVELRVSGLDDSVTSEDIAAAIVQAGDCAIQEVKVGDIKSDPWSLGSVWVRCPIAAAKKVAGKGRLLVGWVSAHVKLLEARAQRCYRCLEPGHGREQELFCSTQENEDKGWRWLPGLLAACPPIHYYCGRDSGGFRNGRQLNMAIQVLQANLNHCARAQDLLFQSMAQWLINIAVIAEPYTVPARAEWVGDLDSTVALVSRSATSSPPFQGVVRGHGFVAATYENIAVVGAYFSPNDSLANFEQFLVEVGAIVRQLHPTPVLFAGDLNAKSREWGSRVTDPFGQCLEEWAVAYGLAVINRGTVNTCVRQQGGSIVDVTFASAPLARRVNDWKCLEDVETLSDHRYIRFNISTPTTVSISPRSLPRGNNPRWALKRLDREVLEEAALVKAWLPAPEGSLDVEVEASWLRDAMTDTCDAAMPRAGPFLPKRQVYWWSAELAQLRESCIAARRQYTRSRRRQRRDANEEAQLYATYRELAVSLKTAIGRAKDRAEKEMLESLNNDPWGRPYKMVRSKLRPWTPPLTQTLQPQLLQRVVNTLFPDTPEFIPPPMAPIDAGADDTDVPEVTEGELGAAVLRINKNKAPGPDGIPGRAWVLAIGPLGPRVRALFSACFEQGRFPRMWKTGKLVLIQKMGRPADSSSAYRPIVLLDEVSKLFERIISLRLLKHLENVGPNLSQNQFGFRHCRSTIDAIARVKTLREEAVSQGGVVLAVSLDISNAFNTLPWGCIKEALKYHAVPRYLRNIIEAYLSERAVKYPVPNDNGWGLKIMSCGVPQGSVLGPLLWNIGYDWVLRGRNLPGIELTCYADDTLISAKASTFREASLRATAGVAQVVTRIRRLGLEVALHKSEAICFHGPRKAPPAGAQLVVSGVPIGVGSTMKYLGLVLDSRWNFKEHFKRLTPRLLGAAGALSRLLPNMGGPNVGCRSLYTMVVRSMALYGAPIWVDALSAENQTCLRRPQRIMAIRAIRGYRTISSDAACALAGTPPWDLEAKALATLYRRISESRARDQEPMLEEVLSGHGCFGKYLCEKSKREPTPACHHCNSAEDTAQHTLADCPSWVAPRNNLVATIGADLSLPTVVKAMTENKPCWKAMTTFCEVVMTQKEAAERAREEDVDAHPLRRKRARRRRVAHDRRLPP
ncbi:uncharacterized protein LOC134793075 [Cydia splendana]|uniref:uncharacterized protein LOC134793075 n=1 Tax=Cydia splendana TaxID=1100963 RepID=UPI00300D86A2